MNKEFTISFWIRIKNNPKWTKPGADINFPPITTGDGVMVFFSKKKKILKVYILHPEVKYKKISVDISKFLEHDTNIALTNADNETRLYLNGELVKTTQGNNKHINLEEGDYVLVNIEKDDLKTINFESGMKVALWARIESVKRDSVDLRFYTPPENATLPKNRIHY